MLSNRIPITSCSVALGAHVDLIFLKIAGVVGKRGFGDCLLACSFRIPFSIIFSLGNEELSRGSGKSLAICRYLTAERYVLR